MPTLVPDFLSLARSLALQTELFFGVAACAFWIAWLVIWILVAVWVYKDAESRRTNGMLWAIIVILLGLIGLIIYLIARPSGPLQPYQAYPGYAGYPQAQYAPPGYAPQAPPQPVQPPMQPPVQQPMQPQMQAPAATGATYCPRCGRPLEYVYQYQRWYCRAENVYPWG